MSKPSSSNPVECSAPNDPDDLRQRINCRLRSDCLQHAAIKNWPSFHCDSCEAFQAMTPTEEQAENAQLAGVFGQGNKQ